MPDSITMDVDDAGVIEAFEKFDTLLATYCDTAAHETAEALQREAQARANRRGAHPTLAQQGRPPLEDLIVIEKMRKGNGWVVLVKNPEGEFEGEPLLLSWWLAQKWAHNRVANPFLWAARAIEEGPHQQRMLTAVQSAIDDAGLGAAPAAPTYAWVNPGYTPSVAAMQRSQNVFDEIHALAQANRGTSGD